MVPVFLHGKKIELRVKLRELSEGVGLADELYIAAKPFPQCGLPQKSFAFRSGKLAACGA